MENVNEIIDNLCAKLGTTIEFIVPEYAKTKIADSLVAVIFIGIALIPSLYILITGFKLYARKVQSESDMDDAILFILAGLILSTIFMVLCELNLSNLIKYAIAPYGSFVEELIRKVR